MADFLPSFNKTKQSEGLWSNDANDSGGETVWGLTRVADKDWDGWKVVDDIHLQFPEKNYFLKKLCSYDFTQSLQSYYKKKYWDKIRGDEIKSQQEAESIYDMYVNSGSEAIVLTQRTLGISETGKMDDITLNTLNQNI